MSGSKQSEDLLSIRHAYANEAELISRLALRSKGHWGYDEDFLDQCKAELSYTSKQLISAQFYFVVALKKAELVGFYALNLKDEYKVELEALFVEPDFIGQGIGKMLLDDALCYLKQQGCNKLFIQGDPNAADFYQRNGAKLIGQLASGSIPERTLPLFEINIS